MSSNRPIALTTINVVNRLTKQLIFTVPHISRNRAGFSWWEARGPA